MAAPPTINLTAALERIDALLSSNPTSRVIRISGDAKVGKSHLLAKVVPALADQRGISCAIVDFKETSIVDILHTLFEQLGGSSEFPRYGRARSAWVAPRPLSVNLSAMTLILSYFRVSILQPDAFVHARDMLSALSVPFSDDMKDRHEPLVVLVFDSFDSIDKHLSSWFNSFVASLLSTKNTRILVGARQFKTSAPAVWHKHCDDFVLLPITEATPYMTYCESLNLNLPEELVQRVLRSLGYKPGSFVEWVEPALSREKSA